MAEERRESGSTGSVLLDIGGDVGALVVNTDSRLLGHEVEARPLSGQGRASHAEVLERVAPGGPVHAVVISGLVAGPYGVWLDGREALGEVEVRGGQVTELDCRTMTA